MNKETLTELGFIEIGNWLLNKDNDTITPQYSKPEFKNTLNTLYAFIYETANNEITLGYIGKTTKSIDARFNGYMKPGSGQQTNIRINQRIKEKLNNGILVEIYVLPDISPLQWQGYNLNIAAGIEDSLINGLRPEWNLHGTKNSNKILNSQEEIEFIIDTNSKSINLPPNQTINLDNNIIYPNDDTPIYFNVVLGVTYYESAQGFMNPGVEASLYLGNNGDPATLTLENNIVLNSIINRTANSNGSVRFHWGWELMNFYQNNFNRNDILTFQIIDPQTIVFIGQIQN